MRAFSWRPEIRFDWIISFRLICIMHHMMCCAILGRATAGFQRGDEIVHFCQTKTESIKTKGGYCHNSLLAHGDVPAKRRRGHFALIILKHEPDISGTRPCLCVVTTVYTEGVKINSAHFTLPTTSCLFQTQTTQKTTYLFVLLI